MHITRAESLISSKILLIFLTFLSKYLYCNSRKYASNLFNMCLFKFLIIYNSCRYWMPLEKFPSEPSWKSMFLRRLTSVTRRIWRYKCRYSNILLLGDGTAILEYRLIFIWLCSTRNDFLIIFDYAAKTGKTSYMNGVFEERARNYNNEKVADPEKKMVRYF